MRQVTVNFLVWAAIAVLPARLAAQSAAACDRACLAGSCENLRSQSLPTLAGIVAHVVAVDEENGTVLLWMDFGPRSLPGPPNATPRSLVTFEAFNIYGGQVHAVEAILEGMPNGTASGWR